MFFHRIAETLGEIYGHGRNLITSRIEYLKLSMAARSARASGMLIMTMIFMLMVLLIMIMLCLALATYFYSLMGSLSLAFLATAGVLILLTIIVYFLRYPLILTPVLNKIVNFLENDDDE